MALLVHTAVALCNIALRHLAIGKPIGSLTESTQEAISCALFYQQTKEEVLREFPWPFAWRTSVVVLVDGTEALASARDFQYAYRLPDDCLRVHRVLGDTRQDDTEERIPFSLGSDSVGGLVFTDVAPVEATDTVLGQPALEYTADVDEARLPSDVAQAIAAKLAFYLAPSLTKGDDFQLGKRAAAMYEVMLQKAMGAAVREQQFDPAPESSFITGRN